MKYGHRREGKVDDETLRRNNCFSQLLPILPSTFNDIKVWYNPSKALQYGPPEKML
jgi:hypothetical protein